METNSFGKRLLEYRKAHSLSQRKMAALMGISPNHLSVLEHGTKHPRPSTEAKFAKISGQQERQQHHDENPMTEAEREKYNLLWNELYRMEPERRQEVMKVFLRIVTWF